jgi:outer membrane protein OmpA-like peptidoglycan-associated protein
MRLRNLLVPLVALAAIASLAIDPAEGQVIRRIAERAGRAAENEVSRQVEAFVANAVRCVFSDLACIERSRENGEDVVLTDEEGNVLYDEEGQPYQDPAGLPPEMQLSAPSPEATFEFVPGDRLIFHDDYAGDNIGDFPRNLTFLNGNWDVVTWEGRRLLRNTGPRHSAFLVELPETLPEMFTIEFDVYFPHGNQQMIVSTSPPPVAGGNWTSIEGNVFRVASNQQAGLIRASGVGVESVNLAPAVMEGLVPFRIMADGSHVKVFVGEQRVANVPNADLRRSPSLYFENSYFADQDNPMLVGPIRVAGGGLDLYDALEKDGRVAVRSILFDTSKDDIRPESDEVLTEIGTMLEEHPELSLMIEGHTDDQGEFDFNMQLSADRAAAVKQYLVDEFGIDPERLRTIGLGQTQPVDTNETPEGRQENRRVELVRIS